MIQTLSTATPFSVRQVCSVMEVSVSGFYAHKNKAQRVRHQNACATQKMNTSFA